MTDLSDADQLAHRYLDLWQDQMAAWANDPAVAEVMARGYVMMKRGMVAYADALSQVVEAAGPPMGSPPTDPSKTDPADKGTTQHGTSGAATAADTDGARAGRREAVGGDPAATADTAHRTASVTLSSDGAADGTVHIENRLAALEERVRFLECALGDRSRGDSA